MLVLEGSAQRLLEHAGDGEGLVSWRRLVAECEPATAGRETSLLLEVLAQTFKGDVRGSLDEFEVKIRYERPCNEVSDRVKIAVVQKGIEDENLRRHVLMHVSRFSTYPCSTFNRHHLNITVLQWTKAVNTTPQMTRFRDAKVCW